MLIGPGRQVLINGDAVIEYETFTAPQAFVFFHGLKIFEDAAIEVIDLLKALLHQVVRRLFAANTASAEHRNLAVFLWIKLCINELWKLPERLSIGRYSILKRADAALIGIAGIDGQHIGVLQEFIPAFRVYPFTAQVRRGQCPAHPW